jgi:hypothetical protein
MALKNLFVRLLLLALMLICFLSSASSVYWSSTVSTNSSSWSIYRQSETFRFDQQDSVEGTISPIDFKGRTLSPYLSCSSDFESNDVHLKERITAREGYYRSEDMSTLESNVDKEIKVNTTKFSSGLYTIGYEEDWPVFLGAGRLLAYQGQNINYQDYAGNNRDSVGSNFLYNKKLLQLRGLDIYLDRMNISILANDKDLLDVEVLPIGNLSYKMDANATGITDLSYRKTGSQYDIKHKTYPALSEGWERYYGSFKIHRQILMNLSSLNSIGDNESIPCCFGGNSLKSLPSSIL